VEFFFCVVLEINMTQSCDTQFRVEVTWREWICRQFTVLSQAEVSEVSA
jgi:hypothetical protein